MTQSQFDLKFYENTIKNFFHEIEKVGGRVSVQILTKEGKIIVITSMGNIQALGAVSFHKLTLEKELLNTSKTEGV